MSIKNVTSIWASLGENLSSGGCISSLISAFVIRFLESFICKLTTGEISIF